MFQDRLGKPYALPQVREPVRCSLNLAQLCRSLPEYPVSEEVRPALSETDYVVFSSAAASWARSRLQRIAREAEGRIVEAQVQARDLEQVGEVVKVQPDEVSRCESRSGAMGAGG